MRTFMYTALAIFATFLAVSYANDEPVGETNVKVNVEPDENPMVTEEPLPTCRGRQVLACMDPLMQWAQEKGVSLTTSGRAMGSVELPATSRDYLEQACVMFDAMHECFADLRSRCLRRRTGFGTFIYSKILNGLEATFGVMCGPKMEVYLDHLACIKEMTDENGEALKTCNNQAAGLGVKVAMNLFGLVSRETICEAVEDHGNCIGDVFEECGEEVTGVMKMFATKGIQAMLRLKCDAFNEAE